MRPMIVVLLVMLGVVDAGAQPQTVGGSVQARAVGGALNRTAVDGLAKAAGNGWVGYSVPMVDGDHQMCCWNNSGSGRCCGQCALEPGVTAGTGGQIVSGTGKPVALEPRRELFVLMRVVGGTIERIRTFSEECVLDVSGTTLQWLGAGTPADSARMLGSFVTAAHDRKLADGALTALAMHRDTVALETLLAAAKNGDSTHVRGQALFWLAQRAGDRAVGAITAAIEQDPETEVKRRAVFALSQLPKDEGVPLMIQVAKTNANPAVRKQAMFWLGQSKDARAVKFFEEILFKF